MKKVISFFLGSSCIALSAFPLLFGITFLVVLMQHSGQESLASDRLSLALFVWILLVGGGLAMAWKAVPSHRLNAMPYLVLGTLGILFGIYEKDTSFIWAGVFTFLFGIVVRTFSWDASIYPIEVNIRWAWLRAVEWIGWPLFVTQPLIPVLLFFYPWYWILATLTVITYFWHVFICPKFISKGLAAFSQQFVLLKFITCPVMAYALWQRGDVMVAILALFWPLILLVTIFPLLATIHGLTGTARTLDIGPVQNRLLRVLGYDRKDSWE